MAAGDLTIGLGQSLGMASVQGLEGEEAAKYVAANLAIDLALGTGLGWLGSKGGINSAKIDFYVLPNGQAVPATGYRYMDSSNLDEILKTGKKYTTYIGFDKFDSATAAQNAYQVSPQWSDSKLRGEFDVLQTIDDIYIPTTLGNTTDILELFTSSYPQYGKGDMLNIE